MIKEKIETAIKCIKALKVDTGHTGDTYEKSLSHAVLSCAVGDTGVESTAALQLLTVGLNVIFFRLKACTIRFIIVRHVTIFFRI